MNIFEVHRKIVQVCLRDPQIVTARYVTFLGLKCTVLTKHFILQGNCLFPRAVQCYTECFWSKDSDLSFAQTKQSWACVLRKIVEYSSTGKQPFPRRYSQDTQMALPPPMKRYFVKLILIPWPNGIAINFRQNGRNYSIWLLHVSNYVYAYKKLWLGKITQFPWDDSKFKPLWNFW